MRNLDDIINYEGESTYVDFKKIFYALNIQKKKEDLIKDIMSMANADVEGERYIVIGVWFDDKKNRQLDGISPADIPEPADYEQLIHENIVPDIPFKIFCHPLDGKSYGIIKIEQSDDNKPYEMRKEYGALKKGDKWIRKGTVNFPMLREDLDRIYAERHRRSRFTGAITVSFDGNGGREAVFPALGDYYSPSDFYKDKIEEALERKRNPPPPKKPYTLVDLLPPIDGSSTLMGLLNPYDYNRYSIRELEEKLATVREDHEGADKYDLYEDHGQLLSLFIENNGVEYLMDAQVKLEIPGNSIRVAGRVYDEPLTGMQIRAIPDEKKIWVARNYPEVESSESSIVITQEIGKIPHCTSTKAFKVPPRIVFSNDLIGTTVEVKCTVYAQNLEIPYVQPLRITVVEPEPQEVEVTDNAEVE